MPLIRFLPGDGTEEQIEVAYIGQSPRNAQGLCAFCNADPCGEDSPPESPIRRYIDRNAEFKCPDVYGVCPMCKGAPS